MEKAKAKAEPKKTKTKVKSNFELLQDHMQNKPKFIFDFDYDVLDARGKEKPPEWVPHLPQVPPKLEGGRPFDLVASYEPAGDQPAAIAQLVENIENGEREQVLLGVTGSGKTFTMAKVIEKLQRPALILAHNKTLAAQLYGEFKSFFPNNAVEYFVSYYDYYQPEAYVPRTDTYIEKDSSVNEQIDRMRHSATRSLLERDDVIIVASVSCIYGIGSVESYSNMTINLAAGEMADLTKLTKELVALQYKRNDIAFTRGTFRVRGDIIDVFPSHMEDRAWRISFFGDEIESIYEFDPLNGKKTDEFENVKIYANNHYTLPRPALSAAMIKIKAEAEARVKWFEENGMLIEAQRLNERTKFDLETMMATGFCAGIENYSRFLTGRAPGEPPPTLFEYLPQNAVIFVDESHQTIPQIGGMFKGDYNRKRTLSEFGFRLPSCMDNRPLRFEEWDAMRPQSVFVSATPGPWELIKTEGVYVEQVIRPTGLIDPPVEVRPVHAHGRTQVDDCMDECRRAIDYGHRVLVTTLTKKMAEDLTDYLHEHGLKVRYMHSDVDTVERIEIVRDLREGVFDILIGINLLREGLDIPECGLVCILDADKEGFLRSETSLVQTIGRAARNAEAKVILYADKITGSMERAMNETKRRREKQIAHNLEHGIIPKTVKSEIKDIMEAVYGAQAAEEYRNSQSDSKASSKPRDKAPIKGHNIRAIIQDLEKQMLKHAQELEFEEAAKLRDQIHELERQELEL
jgi:excinuclease ABC subunit B